MVMICPKLIAIIPKVEEETGQESSYTSRRPIKFKSLEGVQMWLTRQQLELEEDFRNDVEKVLLVEVIWTK